MRQTKSHLYSIILALAALAVAQDAPTLKKPSHAATEASDPATTISVKVKVVNVLATVRDKHGKIVNNLTKEDFTLTEDGRPQSIHYFTRETDLPLTLGLLVDTSLSQHRVLDQERSASHSFLDQMVLEDRDKAFLIHFDREVERDTPSTAPTERKSSNASPKKPAVAFSKFQKKTDRPDLLPDRRRTAQSVQPRLHARSSQR